MDFFFSESTFVCFLEQVNNFTFLLFPNFAANVQEEVLLSFNKLHA